MTIVRRNTVWDRHGHKQIGQALDICLANQGNENMRAYEGLQDICDVIF